MTRHLLLLLSKGLVVFLMGTVPAYADTEPAPEPPGKFASAVDKTETAIKHTASKTGRALEKAADKTGHAIGKAADKTGHALKKAATKTGEALDKTGQKIENAFSGDGE